MEQSGKFIVRDCFGERIGTFTIKKELVSEFCNEIDIPVFKNGCAELVQRYFWELMMKYKTEKQWRAMMQCYDASGHGGDAFYYIYNA